MALDEPRNLDGHRPRRWRLPAALALPVAAGAAGAFGLHSLPLTFLLYGAGCCVLAPWLLLGARPFGARGGLPFAPVARRGWRAEALLGLAFGPAFLAAYLAARPWLGAITDYRSRVAALGVDLHDPALVLAAFVALNPLLEEWWWRGHATPRCVETFGRRRGLALVTAAFAAYHLVLLGALFPWSVLLVRVGLIAAASLLWSHLALSRGGWRAPYVAHLAADAAMAVLFVRVVLPG